MLEIVEQTLNGLTQKPQEYSFPTVTFEPGTIGDYENSASSVATFTLPLAKTIAKPKYMICNINSTASTGGGQGAASFAPFACNGISDSFAYGTNSSSSSSNRYTYVTGKYLATLNTSADTTVTSTTYFKNCRIDAGEFQPIIGFNDYSLHDYSGSSDNVNIRHLNNTYATIATACPDPNTDYTTYGTEIGSEYMTDLSSWETGSYVTKNTEYEIAGNVTVISKISNIEINNSKGIIVFFNTATYANMDDYTLYHSCTLSVWNYTTEAWESLGNLVNGLTVNSGEYTSPQQNNGGTSRCILTTDGTEDWSDGKYADYISDGVLYIGATSSSRSYHEGEGGDVGFALNYIGLGYINGSIWS